MSFSSFDWDPGNWPKCGKHGVSGEGIEEIFEGAPAVMADPHARDREDAVGPLRLAGVHAADDPRREANPADQRPVHAQEGD